MQKTLKTLALLSIALISGSIYAADIPVELQGGWSPEKKCAKKFVWSNVQDAFEITVAGMNSFSGECKATKVDKNNNKYNITWSCQLVGAPELVNKTYQVTGDKMIETYSNFSTTLHRCSK